MSRFERLYYLNRISKPVVARHRTGSSRVRLRQTRLPHQKPIALPRRSPALVDRPDDEALAAAAVARGENAGHAGGELDVVGLGVRPRVALDAEVGEDCFLPALKAHRPQH